MFELAEKAKFELKGLESAGRAQGLVGFGSYLVRSPPS